MRLARDYKCDRANAKTAGGFVQAPLYGRGFSNDSLLASIAKNSPMNDRTETVEDSSGFQAD
jgi:hypothetical protein